MNTTHIALTFAIVVAGCPKSNQPSQASEAGAGATTTMPSTWPPLPTKGFVKGRTATLEDLKSGSAVFTANGAKTSTPHPIEIPQYALMLQGGVKIPCIVVQAERSDVGVTIGARALTGDRAFTGKLSEFELYGPTPPNP